MHKPALLKKTLCFLALAVCAAAVIAGEINSHKRIDAASGPVVIGSPEATTTVDINPKTGSYFNDVKAGDRITFGMDYANPLYFTASDVTVDLKVERKDKNGVSQSTLFPSLNLKYDPAAGATPYIDKTVYTFSNSYEYTVTITDIIVNGSHVTTLPSNLYIDADIKIERYYDFASVAATSPTVNNAAALDNDCDGTDDEIEISWALPASYGLISPEEYQLEWTFVNDYGLTLSGYIGAGSLKYDFKNNSTRITTVETKYKITSTFEHGYLLYRVRAIGRNMNNPSEIITGAWNILNDKGTVSAVSSNSKYYIMQEHEGNKNWQYAATFAEEGKKKEVINYFDGSLRNRQSVTKINSDKNTIVGQTIYDHQGRPAVTVLPVPVPSPSCSNPDKEPAIRYYPKFNMNDESAPVPYSRNDFDIDASGGGGCAAPANGMSITSGSSNYYSPSNPNKDGYQAFVPDAQKFPFTQIEYTPDNTGRIRRQSGVGPTHQLDGHETKYFYAQPNQLQLDRVFGSEVGDAAHYKKNLVIDANGQSSVTYLDQQGRTIATALAGNSASDNGTLILEPLSSEGGAVKNLTVDLFAKDANGKSNMNVRNIENDGLEFSTQLMSCFNSPYIFDYSLNVNPYDDPCFRIEDGFCFNCIYDLQITVTDDCGNIVPDAGGSVAYAQKHVVGNFTTSGGNLVFQNDCNPYNGHEPFTVNLDAGVYTVTKTLKINKEARDFYVTQYLDSTYNKCFKTLWDFTEEELAKIDTTDCYITCATCTESLLKGKSPGDARDAWVADGNGSAFEFDVLLEECGRPCKPKSWCETTYDMLLHDVSPTGQYGEINTIDSPDFHLSVFKELNTLYKNIDGTNGTILGAANWRYPKVKINGNEYPYYLESNGTRSIIKLIPKGSSVTGVDDFFYKLKSNDFSSAPNNVLVKYDDEGGFYYTYPENLANLSDFVDNWKDSWAKSLVQYHPEYCYYEACAAYAVKKDGFAFTSDAFDSLLIVDSSFAQALDDGLIKIISGKHQLYFNDDPFLTQFDINGANYGATLFTKILNFQIESGTYYSMAQIAATAARCGTQYGLDANNIPASCRDFGAGSSTDILDQEWNIAKNFYLSEKQKQQQRRADDIAINKAALDCNSGCNGYNGCIGNSKYNPWAVGMLYSPPPSITTVYPVTFFGLWYFTYVRQNWEAEPYYKYCQPCNRLYWTQYISRKKRFITGADVPIQSKSDAEYQMYLRTGQCPLAFHLQHFLGSLALKKELDNNGAGAALVSYPEFTMDLYNALTVNLTAPETFDGYTWKATSATAGTDNILNVTITNSLNSCNLTLDKTGSGIANWDDIAGFKQLKYTATGANGDEFEVIAMLPNSTGSVSPYSYKTIKGYSCIKLIGCEEDFEFKCEPNDFAVDMSNLMSALLPNDKLNSTSVVNLGNTSDFYLEFLTPSIKNTLGYANNNLRWRYNSTDNDFELYNTGNTNKKIIITFTSYIDPVTGDESTVYTTTASLFPTVKYFEGIKSNGENLFVMNGKDENGNTLVIIHGKAELDNGGTKTPLNMGECSLSEGVECLQGDGLELRDDLEGLLKEVLTKKPFTGDINLLTSPAYTRLISSYLPTDMFYTSSTHEITTDACNAMEHINFKIDNCEGDVCEMNLNHKLKTCASLRVNGASQGVEMFQPYGEMTQFTIDAGVTAADVTNFNDNGGPIYMRQDGGFMLTLTDDYRFSFTGCCTGDFSSFQILSNPITKGTYYRVVCTYDGATAKMFVNGVLTGSETVSITLPNYGLTGIQSSIGSKDASVNQDPKYFHGNIDFVRIYNTAISDNVIQGLYDNSPPPYCCIGRLQDEGIIREWLLDNCYRDEVIGDDGTPVNNPIFQSCPPPPLPNCSAVRLNGNDQWIELPPLATTSDAFQTGSIHAGIVLKTDPSFGYYTPIFSRGDYNVNLTVYDLNYGFDLWGYTDQGEYFEIYSGPISLNTYYDVVCNITSENGIVTAKMYVNGVLTTGTDYNNVPGNGILNDLQPGIPWGYIGGASGDNKLAADINFLTLYYLPISHEEATRQRVEPRDYQAPETFECYHRLSEQGLFREWLLLDNYTDNIVGEIGTPVGNPVFVNLYESVEPEPNFVPSYTFSELIDFYSLTPTGTADEHGNYHDFYALAKFSVDGQEVIDTVWGTSCLPIKDCIPSFEIADTFYSPPTTPLNPCVEQQFNLAYAAAAYKYSQYVDSFTTEIARRYTEHCLNAAESFTANYNDKEYQFTLYYYDQAGNLVKTIPPEGVEFVPLASYLDPAAVQINRDRTYGTHTYFTNHRMATTYLYNSLNQLVRQDMPDHDKMDIFELSSPNGLDNRLQVTGTQFVNSTKGYLSGFVDAGGKQRGYLYTTDDGGQTWVRMRDLVAADLKKVQFVDASIGYAVGSHGIILKTTDGGNSWDMLPLYSSNYVNEFDDLYFIDAMKGILLSKEGIAVVTTNGGSTFSQTGTFTGLELTSVTFKSPNEFYVSAIDNSVSPARGRIFKGSFTAGNINAITWVEQSDIRSTELRRMHITSDNVNAFIAGVDGTLLINVAGGRYQTVATQHSRVFQDIYFADATAGVALMDGELWKTSDGGKNWGRLSDAGDVYNSFYFYQNDKGYAVGDKGLLKRIVIMNSNFGLVNVAPPNAGTTGDKVDLKAVFFNSAAQGWVAGKDGADDKLYYSEDADITGTNNFAQWTEVELTAIGSASDRIVKEIYFNSTNKNGLVLTSTGKVYKIQEKSPVPTSGNKYDIAPNSMETNILDIAEDGSYIFAFDINGGKVKYISETTLATATQFTALANQGDSWAKANVNTLYAKGGSVFIAGKEGDLIAGVPDFGNNKIQWTNLSNKANPLPLRDVQAAGVSVYAVGNEGTLLVSTNGGVWKTIPTASAAQFNAVKFNPNNLDGLIAGNSGYLRKLTSGGNFPLTDINSVTGSDLYDATIGGNGESYIAGANGTVVRIGDIRVAAPTASLASPAATKNLRGIAFRNTTTIAFAVGDEGAVFAYITNAGNGNSTGAKITEVFPPKLNDVHFADAYNGYVIGEKGTIRHTRNSGVKWEIVLPTILSSGSNIPVLNGVWTTQAGKAIMAGNANYTASITDNAITSYTGGVSGTNWSAIAFGSNGEGYVLGNNRNFKKINANGNTVISGVAPLLPGSVSFNFRGLHIFRDNTLIAVGTNKAVLTYNGSWTSTGKNNGISNGTVLNDVFFHDDRNGYAAGNGGRLYKCLLAANATDPSTTISWTAKNQSSTQNIVTVDFPTRYDGFLGGNTGGTSGYARLVHDESLLFSTRFWYDRLGRMVVSQNTKQYAPSNSPGGGGLARRYSYTLYDALGRITEVGEKWENIAGSPQFAGIFGTDVNGKFNPQAMDDTRLAAWMAGDGVKGEVTRTFYDRRITDLSNVPLAIPGFTQGNLRKRVASVTYSDIYNADPLIYQHATHYSYDIHGNVRTLVQDNPSIVIAGQRFKRIDYEYDLVSGKVNKVLYQQSKPDQFIHKYEYDADNRITNVWTSKDNVLWDMDAKYFYYAHGPLARVEMGDNKVQGMDYAYTLQGWVKAVNSEQLTVDNDMGNDGKGGTVNVNFAKDAFGYSLTYYEGDYQSIGATLRAPNEQFEASKTGSDLLSARSNLFNGNISAMVTTLTNPTTGDVLPNGTAYKYDQLNRLVASKAYQNLSGNAWGSGGTENYQNNFTYDANGNIKTQVRKDENGNVIDNLAYQYAKESSQLKQNRLYHVNDDVTLTGSFDDDIDDQGTFTASLNTINTANNYSYDEIGNLKQDKQEGIAQIEWTVYGKIKRITRVNGFQKNGQYPSDLEFNYDASGNRISKIEKPRNASGQMGMSEWKTTYYARDAQGNIMATYKLEPVGGSGISFKVKERNIYGSSRIGVDNTEYEFIGAIPPSSNKFSRTLGNRFYEGTNHLGNVLTVVSDKKYPKDNGDYDTDNDGVNDTQVPISTTTDGLTDFYTADIVSSTDYSPFGVTLNGREFSTDKYRWGYQNQEKVDEISGSGNHYTAEYWEYDPRTGRRWNRDQIDKPWESPYAAFANNPIWFTDPLGLDTVPSNQVDMKTFDVEKDVVLLPEVEIKPAPTPPSTTQSTQQTEANASTANGNANTTSPLLEQSYQGSLVAQFSSNQTGNYKYNYGSPARPLTTINPTSGQQFDCSAWVYYCLSQNYSGLASQIGTNTSSIRAYAQQHGGIRTTNPAVGDLALWVGHVEIVTSVSGQAFGTSGASGKSGAAIPSSKSFSGTSDKTLKYYGSGTFLGFWTPKLPAPKLQVKKATN